MTLEKHCQQEPLQHGKQLASGQRQRQLWFSSYGTGQEGDTEKSVNKWLYILSKSVVV